MSARMKQGLPVIPIPLLRLHPRLKGDEGGLSLRFFKQIMAVPSQSTETTFTFATIPPFLPGAHACQSKPPRPGATGLLRAWSLSDPQHNTHVWAQHFITSSSRQQRLQKHFKCPHGETHEEVAVPVHQQRQNPAKTAGKEPAA